MSKVRESLGTVAVRIGGEEMEGDITVVRDMLDVARLLVAALERKADAPATKRALLRATLASIDCANASVDELCPGARRAWTK